MKYTNIVKFIDIKDKSLDELESMLKQKKMQLFELKLKLKTMQLKNYCEISSIRKEIARINTVISSRKRCSND